MTDMMVLLVCSIITMGVCLSRLLTWAAIMSSPPYGINMEWYFAGALSLVGFIISLSRIVVLLR